MLFVCVLTYLGLLYTNVYSLNTKRDFTILYEWTQLEFDYPSPFERQLDIQNGNFLLGKIGPIDTDVYYSNTGFNKIFVTVPKFQAGVPVSLGTVFTKTLNGNSLINPYPSWSWHTNPRQCKQNRIISVFRIAIDECERLWVLDTGKLLEEVVCPPQLLIFDLRTDTLIHKYEIPSDQVEARSNLVTPIVEVLNRNFQCQDSFAYLADCQTSSIIVYDLRRDTSWKVSDKTMYPHPDFGTYTIEGVSFELMDGILGMSLSPASELPSRKLYFHAMSSPTEHWVYTYHLRNQSLFTNTTPPEIFNTFKGRRQSQAPAEAVDSNGIMFFGLVNEVQIACFNTRAGDYGSYTSSDIVADNPVTLQFPSGVKVIRNKKGEEELWILTSRFQKVSSGTLNLNKINFRIQAARVNDLVSGTQCEPGNRLPTFVPNLQQRGAYGHGFK